jgi:hypothetical protein
LAAAADQDRVTIVGETATLRSAAEIMRVYGWLLVLGSIVAGLLLGARVYLAHTVAAKRVALAQAQKVIADGPAYENTWKQLAGSIYESGHGDTALQALLARHQITVRPAAPAPTHAADVLPAR